MQFNPAPKGQGEKLIVEYTHTANKEIHFASVDWTTGVVACTEAHGLTVGTTYAVLICPDYVDPLNIARDVRSIPFEWVYQATAFAPSIIPQDSMTLLVCKQDGTPLIVNPTSTENTGNVDISKIHFEIPVDWSLTGLPNLKRLRVRSIGYVKGGSVGSGTGSQYRYRSLRYTATDGTTNNQPFASLGNYAYMGFLGIAAMGVNQNFAGIWGMQDWKIDASFNLMRMEYDNYWYGRRTGTALYTVNQVREQGIYLLGASKQIAGITAVYAYGSGNSYAYMANGTIIQIYDMGV